MIIAPGEKVFGALLEIAGAVIVLTGHWATTDNMIADPANAGIWRYGLTDVELSALTATLGPSKRRTPASSSATPAGRRSPTSIARTPVLYGRADRPVGAPPRQETRAT